MIEINLRLASIFRSMADLLQLQGANPHRIRAYRRAADSVEQLGEGLDRIAERGEIRGIPGVGRDLGAKISEYLASGRIQSHEDLKVPAPPEVAEWTALPGLSAPVVHYLYYRLGIRTLPDLEALVRSRLLRTVPGVTGSDEALLAAIQRRLSQTSAESGDSATRASMEMPQ